MSEISREDAASLVRAVVQLASMADRVLPHRSAGLAGPGSGDDSTPPTTATSPGAGGLVGWTGV